MSLPQLLDDGYTRTAYVKPIEGIHPGITFRYRPMMALERQAYLNVIRKAGQERDSVTQIKAAVDIILEQVTDLELKDTTGRAVSVIKDGSPSGMARDLVGRMEPSLMVQVQDVCLGLQPPGEAPAEEKSNGQAEGPLVDRAALRRQMDDDEPAPRSHRESEELQEANTAGN